MGAEMKIIRVNGGVPIRQLPNESKSEKEPNVQAGKVPEEIKPTNRREISWARSGGARWVTQRGTKKEGCFKMWGERPLGD